RSARRDRADRGPRAQVHHPRRSAGRQGDRLVGRSCRAACGRCRAWAHHCLGPARGQVRSLNAVDRNAIGRESKAAVNDVEKGAIRRFAEALGETNPIYFEEAAARAAGYRSVVAPPTFPTTLRAGSDLREGLLLSPGKHLLQAEQS